METEELKDGLKVWDSMTTSTQQETVCGVQTETGGGVGNYCLPPAYYVAVVVVGLTCSIHNGETSSLEPRPGLWWLVGILDIYCG